MATQLPISFRASPLNSDFRGTPQDLLNAIVDRLSIETQESLALFTNGGSEPTSDIGPWLKDGTKWYVWSSTEGKYVPQTIEALADFEPYPFKAVSDADQVMTFAAAGSQSLKLELGTTDTEAYDPEHVFANNQFTAPVDGFYSISAKTAIAVTGATGPAGIIILFYLEKNGIQMPREQTFVPTSDELGGRVFAINTNISLRAGDTINLKVGISVASGTFPSEFTIEKNETQLQGFKIRSL